MPKILIILLILVLLISQSVIADDYLKIKSTGKISGEVIEADSLTALIGARVILYNCADSTVASVAITNYEGKFSIDEIEFGDYYILINYIGYKTKHLDSIYLNPKTAKYKIGKIKLFQINLEGYEVEVVAQRNLMLNQPDKIVVNVNKNLSAYGETLNDVLKTIPSITVDIDNNVSLRASKNIRFLIDGKQTNIDPAELIDLIPASEIDKIELISNPSVKFDAEGDFGIINILLNKDQNTGYRAQVTANAGTGDKYNGSINANYRIGKIYTALSSSYKSTNMFGWSERTQNNFFPAEANSIFRRQDDFHKNGLLGIRSITEYQFDSTHSLELNINFQNSNKKITRNRSYELFDNEQIIFDYYERDIYNRNINNKIDYYLTYNSRFDKNSKELNIGAFISKKYQNNNYDYSHYYFYAENDEILPSQKPVKLDISKTKNDAIAATLQADFSGKINKESKFEAGYKTNFREIEMDYEYDNFISNLWVKDTNRTNYFRFSETTSSLYAIYSSLIFGVKYSFGLRGEYTSLRTRQFVTNESFADSYFNLFPSLQAQYEINPYNSINLKVNRRINRPKYKELNPFIDYSDPQELSSGNPNLTPELTYSGEIGYWGMFKKSTLLFNIFYKNINNSIVTIHSLLDSATIYATPENFQDVQNIGTELMVSVQPFKPLIIDGNISLYQSDMKVKNDSLGLSTNFMCWNTKLIFTLVLGKTLSVQLSSIYNSPFKSTQIETYAYFTSDLGLKLNLLKNKLTLNMKINDIFKTMNNSSFTDTKYFTLDYQRQRDTRYVIFGLTYNFNNYKNSKLTNSTDDDDEVIHNEVNED